MADLEVLVVRVPPDLKEWLEAQAVAQDRSAASLVRRVLADYQEMTDGAMLPMTGT